MARFNNQNMQNSPPKEEDLCIWTRDNLKFHSAHQIGWKQLPHLEETLRDSCEW